MVEAQAAANKAKERKAIKKTNDVKKVANLDIKAHKKSTRTYLETNHPKDAVKMPWVMHMRENAVPAACKGQIQLVLSINTYSILVLGEISHLAAVEEAVTDIEHKGKLLFANNTN